MSTVTVSPQFAQMVSASQIEEDIIRTLQKWYPTYLAEVARQLEISPTLLPQPQNYTNRNSFDAEPGEMIPKVVVIAAGLLEQPVHDAKGNYRAIWRVGVGIATGAKDEETANMLAKAYGAATRAIVLNKTPKEAQNVDLANIAWIEEAYPDIPIPQPLMLYKAASLFFALDIQNVVNRWGGPDLPTLQPPPSYGEVQEVFIDVEQEVVTK